MDQPPVLTVSGRIATVTLTRPDVANRMNPSDLRVFADHIEAINEMKDVLVLRVLSTGKYFCSGFDINAFGAEKTGRDMSFGDFVDVLEQARPVTIAGIQGGVYGGATDMCIACDLLGMKKHLNRIAHGNLDVLDLERDELLAQMSEDLKEGGLAWKEKRKPVFRGV